MRKGHGSAALLLALLSWSLVGCATTSSMRVREDVPACLPSNAARTYRMDVDMVKRQTEDVPDWLKIDSAREAYGKGSGIVIGQDGLILTNAHVVTEEGWRNKVSVTVWVRGTAAPVKLDGTVVAIDKSMDLAVVKVDRTFPSEATFVDDTEIVDGMAVYSVGHPFDFGEMVGRGHVMRQHFRDPRSPVQYQDTLLVEISDGPGTSGSGVFSSRTGKMIGLMMAYTFRVAGPDQPPMVVRVVIPIDRITRFLDANDIPYRTSPPGTPVCQER